MFIVNCKTVFITAQFKEIEERLPSPTEQTADPAKKADSYKMAGAQVTQEQEKHLKMVSRDEVLVVCMPPSYNVIFFLWTSIGLLNNWDNDVAGGYNQQSKAC